MFKECVVVCDALHLLHYWMMCYPFRIFNMFKKQKKDNFFGRKT